MDRDWAAWERQADHTENLARLARRKAACWADFPDAACDGCPENHEKQKQQWRSTDDRWLGKALLWIGIGILLLVNLFDRFDLVGLIKAASVCTGFGAAACWFSEVRP